jgi:hypothetical protein
MITPLSVNTIFAVLGISGMLMFAIPYAPLLVLGFQAGLFAGIFLHSAHSSESITPQSESLSD